MYAIIKRGTDIILAVILLIVFAIPMVIIAIAIKLEDGNEIIYRSRRIGKGIKEFNVYKFRTMKSDREELKSNLAHEQMVTKIGKFLRRTSLDELPQLFNIIKGEMSFIGPRPWIPEYYEFFTEEQMKRASIRPGISGLAQVKGRNGISIFEKINYDLEYIEKMGLWQDIKIVFETIKTVVSKENAEISEQGIKEEIQELKINNIKIKQNATKFREVV